MADDAGMSLKQLLRAAMLERGITQRELGALLVNESTGEPAQQGRVTEWLSGKARPSRDYYKSVGKVLGMSKSEVSVLIGSERDRLSIEAVVERLDEMEARIDQVTRLVEALEERQARRR